MNFGQRLTIQPSFRGGPTGGVNAALIGLHPCLQYGLGVASNPLKSLMALALVAPWRGVRLMQPLRGWLAFLE
jgi:hypothetical protein